MQNQPAVGFVSELLEDRTLKKANHLAMAGLRATLLCSLGVAVGCRWNVVIGFTCVAQ
jgi:hypothetical protein